jgi:hypothetical protein
VPQARTFQARRQQERLFRLHLGVGTLPRQPATDLRNAGGRALSWGH